MKNVLRAQCADGRVYVDPVLSGVGWFICFDADDPPELVLAARGLNPRQARARAVDVVTELGISAVVCGWPRRSVRPFVDGQRLQRLDAYGFFLDLLAPINWDEIPADYRGLRPAAPESVLSSDRPFA